MLEAAMLESRMKAFLLFIDNGIQRDKARPMDLCFRFIELIYQSNTRQFRFLILFLIISNPFANRVTSNFSHHLFVDL